MLEDNKHMLIQCPLNQCDLADLMIKITAACCGAGRAFIEEPSKVLFLRLGKSMPGVGTTKLNRMRILAGTATVHSCTCRPDVCQCPVVRTTIDNMSKISQAHQ